ncbi:MAG: topoisomerase DNA-binding C4 zinc finger domain-containing protein, partial [Verrucomicrobia bacterium]|nr:topoisomerase DNA-binding C4 zinc finger domain-containing protein [Verrucomicrobiota bacterium]
DCPAIGCDGKIHPRRSRFGKVFFSCSNYPDCDVIGNSLEELETKYQDHPKTAYVSKKSSSKKASSKKTTAKKKASSKKTSSEKTVRKQKTYTLSPALAAIVGEEPLSRPEIVKKMWDYIKSHECQDPKNKRLIRPDTALEKVFGSKEPIDMMKLAGLLSSHIL